MVRSNLVSISVSPQSIFQINITNTQNNATPVPFQQMIQLPISQLGLINPYVKNIGTLRFSYNGSYIPAWLESISNGTATIWVKLPVSILANASITIDMEVDPSLNFDGNYWGEAPQLSPTYGEYDNGASVFIYYQNFAGTSIPSGWSTNSYTNAVVNNGLKINSNTAGQWENFIYSTAFNPQTTVADFYAYATDSNPDVQIGWNWPQYFIDTASSYGLQNYNGSPAVKVAISGGSYSSYQVWSIGETGSTGTWATLNYGNMVANTGSYTASTSNQIVVNVYSNSVYAMIQWLRTRAYPPNGVMPSVEVIA